MKDCSGGWGKAESTDSQGLKQRREMDNIAATAQQTIVRKMSHSNQVTTILR